MGAMTLAKIQFDLLRRRVFNSWMQLGTLLHKLTSPVILFVLFFLIFTPYAILVRIFRRHPSFDRRPRTSYWEKPEDKSQPGRNFQRQF
jgi:hypothetical protein